MGLWYPQGLSDALLFFVHARENTSGVRPCLHLALAPSQAEEWPVCPVSTACGQHCNPLAVPCHSAENFGLLTLQPCRHVHGSEDRPAMAKNSAAATFVMGGCLAAASRRCTTATASAATPNWVNTMLSLLRPCTPQHTHQRARKACPPWYAHGSVGGIPCQPCSGHSDHRATSS